ncbi:MAG: polyprenyl synthetase family protein, partial [Burkholderiales bacterium]|nr:polyprenyl synthetase family protein [Burkholderiales bacterium]
AACGGVPAVGLAHLSTYGQHLGLAFQVVDDILDVVADTQTLGKTAGKDAEHHKPTFVSLLGLAGAKTYASALLDRAHAALAASGLPHTHALHALADLVGGRTH